MSDITQSFKHRFLSTVLAPPQALQAIFGNFVHGYPQLVDNTSTQATGAGGALVAKVKTSGAAILTFGGIPVEVATASAHEAANAALLPAVNDAICAVVGARMKADLSGFDLVSTLSGVKASPASIAACLAVSAPAGGYIAALAAQCASRQHLIVLGVAMFKRTGDTAVTVTFDHRPQIAQFYVADPQMAADALLTLL